MDISHAMAALLAGWQYVRLDSVEFKIFSSANDTLFRHDAFFIGLFRLHEFLAEYGPSLDNR